MKEFSVLTVLLGVFLTINSVNGSRIVKRWAFLANHDESLKTIPHNCDDIVQQYANGQMVMYEYKIKMSRCLKGKKEALKSSITSKYEDDSNANFFKSAMKYVDDDGGAKDYNEEFDDDSDKKSNVPAIDAQWSNQVPSNGADSAANMYPNQGVTPEQVQNLDQSQAAFAQNPKSNQVAPVQQNYNFFTRSDIPAAQPQQDMTQWNAPVQAATKKDALPAAPADDPFASFMNIQSSQNAAAPQATQQQRSDIPAPVPSPQELQQRSEIPIDASYQAPAAPAYNTVPANQQAFFRDQIRAWSPEDHGLFPENP